MNYDTSYYRVMDSDYLSTHDPDYPELEAPILSHQLIEENREDSDRVTLTPSELGIGTNPFIHPLQGVNARLHDGASKMEISFFGQGKGNKERFTPESIDKVEREDIKNLLKINEAKMSVHASVAVEGLSGFNAREGFSEEQREVSIREIEKAIDFARDASTGGAIVFHTGEWQRPISEQPFGTSKGGMFRGHDTEEDKASLYVVDSRTGQINGVKKDHLVYEPIYLDVKLFAKDRGFSKDKNGNYRDKKGKVFFEYQHKKDEAGVKLYKDTTGKDIFEDDWVNKKGELILPDPNKPDAWFERIPLWDSQKTQFKVDPRDFKFYEKKAEIYKKRYGIDLTPEELFVKSQLSNKVLQYKGNSLYHGQRYDDIKFRRDKYAEALKFYEKLEVSLSEKEKWKLTRKKMSGYSFDPQFDMSPEYETTVDYLRQKVKDEQDQMRHIHSSSASADAEAKQTEDQIKRTVSLDKYALDKTAASIARLARKVYVANQNKKDPSQKDLYLAPENWQTTMFGGHPDEMIQIVQKARKRFAEENSDIIGAEKAKKVANDVIKSTIDVGHLNVWRRHFKRKSEMESDESFNNRFDDWLLKEIDKMDKAGVLGHFHLADNFGFDDEHLTPGRGNAPIKEFVKKLKAKGYDDFIVEAGSFNTVSTLHDTWSYFGTPIYSHSPRGSFRQMHQAHFPYKSTPLYIAGAYAPSNEFKMWTEVPLH